MKETKKGKSVAIYLQPDTVRFYEAIKRECEESKAPIFFPDILNEAIKQAYYRLRTKVKMTPGAYLALANRDANSLSIMAEPDGAYVYLDPDAAKRLADNAINQKDMDNAVRIGTEYALRPALLMEACDREEWERKETS